MAAIVEVLFNPRSGSYAPARIARLRRAFERRGARVVESATGEGPVRPHAEATHLCVAGGDGTVRHVVQGVRALGRTVPIGHYPCGTVNLLAREAALDCAPDAFAARLLSGADRPHHAVAVESAAGETLFLCTASAGPEARAVAGVSPALKRRIGRAAYAVAALALLRRWPRTAMHVTVGERRIACEAFYVAKGRYFAGSWSLAAEAATHRADMILVTLATARRRDLARLWWAMLLRRPVAALPGVTTLACTAFRAEAAGVADGAEPVQLDGDADATLPARFRLVAEPLPFA